MCNFDPNELNNLVEPCVETPTAPENPGGETGEEGSGDNSGNNNNNNNNNNGGSNNNNGNGTTPPPIDPIWGLGGFSLDEENENN